MEIQINRKTIFLLAAVATLIVAAIAIIPLLRGARASSTSAVSDDETELARATSQLAAAFGQGDLYREPDKYPLTARLAESIKKLSNRGETWPAYSGPTGDVVVVLRGTDTSGQAFVDVSAHILNKSAGGTGLTQVNLRFVKDGGSWKADRLYSVSKGDIRP